MAKPGPNEKHDDEVVPFNDNHASSAKPIPDPAVLASRHAWLEDAKPPPELAIPQGSKQDELDYVDVQLPDESHFSFLAHWREELTIMLKLALPCIVANTSTQLMVITDQIFVGQIGVDEFAAAALANTWFNLLWSFMLGASTAMDTLASQAYGAKDYRSLLVWTYSGLIINTLFCFPLMGALLVGEHTAAVLFHQGYGPVATLVSDFCKALVPGLWPLIWSLILMKFLQTQNSMAMPAIIAGLACVINVGINFGLVGAYGFVGSPWATTACRIVQVVLILIACIHQQHKAIKRAGLTWHDWMIISRMAFKTAWHHSILWEHGKLALAGGIMNAFEATAFDVTTAFAGALGVTATAAHAALLSICNFCFNALPFAISIAATIRCANLLGAGRPKQARLAGILSMVLGVAFQGATGIILGASQGQVVRIFTSDPAVLAAAKNIAWLAMLFQFSDGLFGTAQGVLRAMGGQVGCIVYNFVGFWGGGVVVGWFLTFKVDMGLAGLWIGLLSGNAVATFLSMIALSRCNWHAAAAKLFAEVQQAALDRAAGGDLTEQLAADEARGLITHVDMSDFSKEMQLFIIPPVDDAYPNLHSPREDILTTHQSVAAVLAALKHRSSTSLGAAPGLIMQTRGGSVTVARLANSRMMSRSSALHSPPGQRRPSHFQLGQQGVRHPVSPGAAPMAGGIEFHDDVRQSDCVRLMRPSVFCDRDSGNERHSNTHSHVDRHSNTYDMFGGLKAQRSIYQPPVSHLAAALSRGGAIQPVQVPLAFRQSVSQIGVHEMSSASSIAGLQAGSPRPGLIIMSPGSSRANQAPSGARRMQIQPAIEESDLDFYASTKRERAAVGQAAAPNAVRPAREIANRLEGQGQSLVQPQAAASPVSPGVQGGWSKAG